MPKQGDIVLYQRKKLVDGKTAIVSVPATVLSVITEESYNGPNGEPALNLAFFDESRSAQLATTDWRNAFDRATGVKHASHEDLLDGKELQRYVLADVFEDEAVPPSIGDIVGENTEKALSGFVAAETATPVNTPPAGNQQQIAGEGDTSSVTLGVEPNEGLIEGSTIVDPPQAEAAQAEETKTDSATTA